MFTVKEIETIISQATPTNTKEATACNVSVFKGTVFVFILVQFDDFKTVIEMHVFKGFLKLNIKTFAALFARALLGFTSARLQTRNSNVKLHSAALRVIVH